LEGQGRARLEADFERALHARPVSRVEARGGRGVEAREHLVEVFGAAPLAQGAEPPAQARVRRRACEERLAERAQVEAAAADEDGEMAARLDRVNRPDGLARPVRGGVAHLRRDEVDEVVRDAAPLREGHLRRRDLDPAVDLHRVAVDHLAPEAQRERDPQIALARRGRADDRDDGPG
jgi:hypothetical protein